MIDVPVEVKDALRDGRLKKNYRIVVLQQYTDIYEIYSSHETFTAPITATYLLYNNTTPNSFRYVEITPISGGETYSINCPDNPDKTWLEFPLNEGDVIYVGNSGEHTMLAVNDKKNNTEDFTIDNNNLVAESVSIDERMCSGNKIKFGLCEGSSLEFQYFGFPTLLGRRVQVFIDVDYGAENPYTIPMGYFDVQKCSRQASTGIIKVTAYNKLMSDYLDTKASELLLEDFDGQGSTSLLLFDIQRHLLSDYEIVERPKNPIPIPSSQAVSSNNRADKNLFFSEGKNIDTPLSGYLFNQSLRDYTPYTPSNIIGKEVLLSFFESSVSVTATSDQYWLLYSLKKNLNVFVSNLVDYIIDIVYGAGFKKNASTTAALYTREEIETIIKTIGNIIYIQLSRSGSVTSYSLLNNAEKTIDNINKLIHHENITITFSFPIGIGLRAMGNEHGSGTTCYDVLGASFLRSYQYKYYVGEPYVEETKTAPAPQIKFWDGSVYNGVINEILYIAALDLSDAEKLSFTIDTMPDFTLRDIISADYETQCQYGKLDRVTDLFSGVELNHSRLYPAETLYPDDVLYPEGAQSSANKSMYSQLWADEGNVRKWRNLLITYKGLDENQQEKDFTAQYIINSDGTDDYDCSDNWLFRNLIWTEEQIDEYALAMMPKMQDMAWFPFEMWCAGLPYLETGDEIEIPLGQNSYTSYVLQRQLKGIQNLQDTYINGTLDIF